MFTVGLDTSALDPGFKAHAGRGIGRYVTELKRYLDGTRKDRLEVGFFDHRSLRAPGWLESSIARLPAGRETVRQQIVYPLSLKLSRSAAFNVMHFPAHMDAPSWSMRRYIITVLDLIPLVCADLYKADRPGWRYRLARWLEIRAIKNASLILAISENTARDVERLLGIPRERIVVTPLGVDEKFFGVEPGKPARPDVRARLGLPAGRPIVLYVGGIDPRKNYTGLIRTFRGVIDRCREAGRPRPLLVMAGNISSDREYPKLTATISSEGLRDDVSLPGYVKDEDLLDLYAESSVFFFPSLYEGFGLPPLEAMAAGTPVVSSNTSAMPEVLGDSAILVDPEDPAACASGITEVLENPALAGRLRESGRRQARGFTWKRTGDTTIAAYESLAKAN